MNSKYFKSIIFMKVGYHSDENLEEIIERKKREEKVNEFLFWGYGGTLCHPVSQVRPFIRENLSKGLKTMLFMSFTPSKYISQPKLAQEYSLNRKIWHPIPSGVSIRGSRYAIICKNLEKFDTLINLNMYNVAIGINKGRPLGEVIKYRVDKACGFIDQKYNRYKEKNIKILYIAEIVEPFAVLLR